MWYDTHVKNLGFAYVEEFRLESMQLVSRTRKRRAVP